MIRAFSRIWMSERPLHAIRSAVGRSLTGRLSAINGAIMGWSKARVPLGSRVYGSRYIVAGTGFEAAEPIWLEAISTYNEQVFVPRILIGKRFKCSGGLHLTAVSKITIGDDCLFGRNVLITDHQHGCYDSENGSRPDEAPARRSLHSRGPVLIGSNCWIGDNVVILENVKIGEGAVLGANSVVTRDVPARSIAAGVPARVIKSYSQSEGGWVSQGSATAGENLTATEHGVGNVVKNREDHARRYGI